MADKKVFSGFGYEPGTFIIPDEMRVRLASEFEVTFTNNDFADMGAALDVCHGAWAELRTAPKPADLARQIERIGKCAATLLDLLNPRTIDSRGRDVSPSAYTLATQAANRVKARANQHWSGSAGDDELVSDRTGMERMNKLGETLRQLQAFAHEVKDGADETLDVPGIGGIDALVEVERGTLHLRYLRNGLKPVCKRHNWPTRFSNFAPGHSRVCTLAFRIGKLLPREAWPRSIVALEEQWRYERKPRRRPRAKV